MPAVHEHTVAPHNSHEVSINKSCVVPIEFTAGLFSMFPDNPWIFHCVANNSRGELRSVGEIAIPEEAFASGNSCHLCFTADVDCTLEIFLLLRDPEPSHNTPTWNSISPNYKWDTPGGISETDGQFIGTVQITTGQVGEITMGKISQPIEIACGEKLNHLPHWGLLIRRGDTGPETVNITGELKIEKDNG